VTIADRAVLVTGANRGIGQAPVEEALRRGVKRVYAGARQPLAHPNGSPASGGYAGAKATQRFIAAYAQDESRRTGLDITVTAAMLRMTAFGAVSKRGVRCTAFSGLAEDQGAGSLWIRALAR
jgi:NAD(P)-dependent dehydrogenase (short-subunit alcohol dehydrogenase family)